MKLTTLWRMSNLNTIDQRCVVSRRRGAFHAQTLRDFL
jgi:hypothetical protein